MSHSSEIRCKLLQNNGIRTAHELCAMMRKAAIFAHQNRRTARIWRPLAGSAERNPQVTGEGHLGPACVGQPDQPDEVAAAGRKLLTGLSFHGGDSFRVKIQ